MNLDANNFQKRMLKDMYSSVQQITEENDEQLKEQQEDDLSDKSDIEYKNYSMQAELEEQTMSKVKNKIKLLMKKNLKDEIEEGQVSEEDFILDHY